MKASLLLPIFTPCAGSPTSWLLAATGVSRVIARPFVGTPGHFERTANRKDFALPPTGPTLLDSLRTAEYPVVAIGKIDDLFAGRGISRAIHTSSDDEGMDAVEGELDRVREGMIFANLVDSDTLFGHRNDVRGYAANLERIDARVGELVAGLAVRGFAGRDGRSRKRPDHSQHGPFARVRARPRDGAASGPEPGSRHALDVCRSGSDAGRGLRRRTLAIWSELPRRSGHLS